MSGNKKIKRNDPVLDPKILHRAIGLLTAILDEKTPESLRIDMTDWFCSNWSTNEKYAALEQIMHEQLQPNYSNDPFAAQKLKELKARLKKMEKEQLVASPMPIHSKRPSYLGNLLKVAAVLVPILIISGSAYFGLGQKSSETFTVPVAETTIETAKGTQKEVFLPDGTHVWINSDSKITYPESFDAERYVQLEGEAYFEVQHNTEKPFFVRTKHINIKVLGTKFNTSAYPDNKNTTVSLLEGLVEIKNGENTFRLNPDEKFTYNYNTGSISIGQFSDINNWHSDIIYTKRKTLDELFQLIENYYGVEFVYNKEAFKSTELYTIALQKKESAEKITSILSETSGLFTVKAKDGKIYIEKL